MIPTLMPTALRWGRAEALLIYMMGGPLSNPKWFCRWVA